jgi:hypothetical protein
VGGAEEKAAEIAAGNPDAKDWQDEARKVVEKTVSFLIRFFMTVLTTNRWPDITIIACPL